MSQNSRKAIWLRLFIAGVLSTAIYASFTRPAIDQIRLCEELPTQVTPTQLAQNGLGHNRFVEVTSHEITPNDEESVLHSLSTQSTYVRLEHSEGAHNTPPIVAKLAGHLETKDIEFIFSADRLAGFVYRPEASVIPGIPSEASLLQEGFVDSAQAPIVVELLDSPPSRWKSLHLWLSLPLILYLTGYGLAPLVTDCIESSIMGVVIAAFCILALVGVGFAWGNAGQDAVIWKPVPATVLGQLGIAAFVGFLLTICRSATVLLCDEAKPTAVADGDDGPIELPPFQPTSNGFAIRDGNDIFEFANHDVLGVGVLMGTTEVDDGVLCQRVVRLRVREGEGSDVLRITDVVKAGEDDPMHEFLRRLTQEMSQRYENEVTSGGELRGSNWSLNQIQLTRTRDGNETTISTQNIASFDWINNAFSIWEIGREEPWLRLPAESENVHILAALLPKLIDVDDELEGEQELGRQLIEISQKSALGSQLLGAFGKQEEQLSIKKFRCFDHGVTFDTETETIRLEGFEIGAFAVQTVKHSRCVDLWSANDETRYRLVVPVSDEQRINALDYCEDHLARMMSNIALKNLITDNQFNWTPELTLKLDGLHERRPDGTTRVHRLGDIESMHATQNAVVIRNRKGQEHTVSIPRSAKNALVGMYAVKGLKSVYSDTCQEFRLPPADENLAEEHEAVPEELDSEL